MLVWSCGRVGMCCLCWVMTMCVAVLLCCGVQGVSLKSGVALWYKGSRFHRVLPGKLVQGGDISRAGDGRGGESVFGGTGVFDDESFEMGHDRGVLSMANNGLNSNRSQFFVCLKRMASLDGKHVVFGRVLSGLRVFDLIGSKFDVDGSSGAPAAGWDARIVGCGLLRGVDAGSSASGGGVSVATVPLQSKSASSSASASASAALAMPSAKASGVVAVGGASSSSSDSSMSKRRERSEVWLDVVLSSPDGSEDRRQRVRVELFDDVVPVTARNFVDLVSGKNVSVVMLCCCAVVQYWCL